jgi:hypothetical protein
MPAHQRADLFRETAERMDIPEAVVEKDFWVCWVLKQLFSIEAFSGRLLLRRTGLYRPPRSVPRGAVAKQTDQAAGRDDARMPALHRERFHL